jgi:hypothetical protein
MDIRSYGHVDIWTGHVDIWTCGHMDIIDIWGYKDIRTIVVVIVGEFFPIICFVCVICFVHLYLLSL